MHFLCHYILRTVSDFDNCYFCMLRIAKVDVCAYREVADATICPTRADGGHLEVFTITEVRLDVVAVFIVSTISG